MLSGINAAVGSLQYFVYWALLLVSLGLKGFALVDALTRKPAAFVAAGKLTKVVWLSILAIALAVNVLVLWPLQFLNIAGFVAAAVYLVDVRPALQQVRGGGSSGGPYGGW